MFDFEKLEVYQKSKVYNKQIIIHFLEIKLSPAERDQLRRAALSVVLNIAEGSGRFSKPDKRRFYVVARGSVFETVAILEVLLELNYIDKETYLGFYLKAEEISKMLFSMIKALE